MAMKLDDLERLSEFEDVCVSELPRLLALIRQMKEALESVQDDYLHHTLIDEALQNLATYEAEND